jgi:hypothetical protein
LQVCTTVPSLFFDTGLLFAQDDLELQSSHRCLLHSWDYRCEPLHLALFSFVCLKQALVYQFEIESRL